MAISKDQLISDLAEAINGLKPVRALLEQLSEIVTDAFKNNDKITLRGLAS